MRQCEHIDFETGDTILERDIYESDKLFISKVKCEECGKEGIILEVHFDHNNDNCFIEGEINWNVTVQDDDADIKGRAQ